MCNIIQNIKLQNQKIYNKKHRYIFKKELSWNNFLTELLI